MNILSSKLSSQPIASSSINNTEKGSGAKTKTSIFYINDLHGQIPKMQRLVSAGQHAELMAEKNGADILKVCSGDTFIGSDEKRNIAAASFLNVAGIDAEAPGNHEFDITASVCGKLLKNSKTHILGMNMNFPDDKSDLSQKVVRSVIKEGKNGEKYGLIGLQPSDIHKRMKKQEALEGITIDDKEQTLVELQEEVNKLQEKGVNKIFLLSHQGNTFEKEIAQKINGIDVIFGGHSHDLIEDVKEGENLFYTPSGEPVVITQAGRDGNHFGVLNLEFNDKGQISYVQNNVMDTNTYSSNLIMSKTIDSILGESPIIGELKHVDPLPKNANLEENPWADFVADALKTNLDADIALVNSANFRGSVDYGTVTERDISSIFPFNNKLYKVKINEKDIVDAVKLCAKTYTAKNLKPGIMQVSGLSYKIDKAGNLLEMSYHDKQGQIKSIDVNNPDPNKTYTAIYDEFLINGGDDMTMLKREDKDILERYTFDKDKVTIDYIKSLKQPFEVRKDGRITIV
jgi:2',3'-cyclic-nucleotide 2'-phosphodiesterase (5'-nucleotidase family)